MPVRSSGLSYRGSAATVGVVKRVLLATDADWLFDEVAGALAEPGTTVARISEGRDVSAAVSQLAPDLVLLDLQIGSKGGIAACIDLRHDIATGRAEPTKIMMLLDRDADRWIARQADADGWLIKPIDSLRLRRAAVGLRCRRIGLRRRDKSEPDIGVRVVLILR